MSGQGPFKDGTATEEGRTPQIQTYSVSVQFKVRCFKYLFVADAAIYILEQLTVFTDIGLLLTNYTS